MSKRATRKRKQLSEALMVYKPTWSELPSWLSHNKHIHEWGYRVEDFSPLGIVQEIVKGKLPKDRRTFYRGMSMILTHDSGYREFDTLAEAQAHVETITNKQIIELGLYFRPKDTMPPPVKRK
jgi:hypothetical protein